MRSSPSRVNLCGHSGSSSPVSWFLTIARSLMTLQIPSSSSSFSSCDGKSSSPTRVMLIVVMPVSPGRERPSWRNQVSICGVRLSVLVDCRSSMWRWSVRIDTVVPFHEMASMLWSRSSEARFLNTLKCELFHGWWKPEDADERPASGRNGPQSRTRPGNGPSGSSRLRTRCRMRLEMASLSDAVVLRHSGLRQIFSVAKSSNVVVLPCSGGHSASKMLPGRIVSASLIHSCWNGARTRPKYLSANCAEVSSVGEPLVSSATLRATSISAAQRGVRERHWRYAEYETPIRGSAKASSTPRPWLTRNRHKAMRSSVICVLRGVLIFAIHTSWRTAVLSRGTRCLPW